MQRGVFKTTALGARILSIAIPVPDHTFKQKTRFSLTAMALGETDPNLKSH
jgi:hypothetical protein